MSDLIDEEVSRRRPLPPESRVRTDSTSIVNKRASNSKSKVSFFVGPEPDHQEETAEEFQPKPSKIRDATSYSRRELLGYRQADGFFLSELSLSDQLVACGLSRSAEKKIAPILAARRRKTVLIKNNQPPASGPDNLAENAWWYCKVRPATNEVSFRPPLEGIIENSIEEAESEAKSITITAEQRKAAPKDPKRRVHFAVEMKTVDNDFEHLSVTLLINHEQ